jgi:dihydrofolate reductase
MTDPVRRRTIGLIWACNRSGVIGAAGAIPWHIPEDMDHFKVVTTGRGVVMGRKTWDSLPSRFRPLPGRRNVVVTRNHAWNVEGAERVGSVAEALALTDPAEVWVIGGGEIYRDAMEYANVIAVTEVDTAVVDPDTYAPAIGPEFALAYTTGYRLSENGTDRYLFRSYTRNR